MAARMARAPGLARIAEPRGDIEEALKRWTVVIGRVRDSSEGEAGCARCLIALGRLDEAEARLEDPSRI
jgi:hypothetical protein